MSAVLAVARADFRERTRTFALLVVIAATLQLGYLFVPDASASYSTVDLGGWRGVYDSAWMGATTALLTVTLLPLAGFFLVRPAGSRDATLGTYEIVAAAPLSRAAVVLAKWASDVALLGALAVLLVLAAVAMQWLRAEDRSIDVLAYVVPLMVFTLPACAITATCAIAVDAVPWLRGIGGGVLWFFVWNALIDVPLLLALGKNDAVALDPLGFTSITMGLMHGLQAVAPGANAHHDVTLGSSNRATHVFRFTGIAMTAGLVAGRAAWVAGAALVAYAVAPFALAAPRMSVKARRLGALPARIVQRLPVSRLVRAELAAALGGAGTWWAIGATALALAALAVPAEVLARGIAPLIWIWPVGPISAATVVDARANLDGVLLATPTAPWRRVLARWAACVALAIVPVLALAVRNGGAGIALVAIACAAAAVAVALGTVTRAALAFEGLALAAWYLGPVNRVPPLDPASSTQHVAAAVVVSLAVVAGALGIATVRSGRRG